jgi:hypothetical protein
MITDSHTLVYVTGHLSAVIVSILLAAITVLTYLEGKHEQEPYCLDDPGLYSLYRI